MAEHKDNDPFPIQGGYNWNLDISVHPSGRYPSSTIPWWLAEKAYKRYSAKYGTDQSLERLAERGGFGREELIQLLSGNECDHTNKGGRL